MNTIEIIEFLCRIGLRFTEKTLKDIVFYINNMIKDNRVIVINKDNEIYCVLMFSLEDNWEKFLKKQNWVYVSHNPFSETVYIEKIVSLGFDKELRKVIESELTKLYPHIKYGIWHRYAKWGDRKVIAKRRLNYVRN